MPTWAQERTAPVKRALVVGIGSYQHANPLATPPFDADLVFNALKKLDPQTDVMRPPSDKQLGRNDLLDLFEKFRDNLHPGDIAIVYFSGHGIEVDRTNYLVPADAQLSPPGDETATYISLPYLVEEIQKTGAGTTVIILDACRSNPFSAPVADEERLDPKRLTAVRPVQGIASNQYQATGSGSPKQPKGFLVYFAAQAGRPSYSLLLGDDPKSGSIFTRSLVQLLTTKNQPAYQIFNSTSGVVARLTQSRQEPLIAAFNSGQIMFMDNQNLAKDEMENWFYTVANATDDELVSALPLFIDNYPAGPFSATARKHLMLLKSTRLVTTALTNSSQIDVGMLGGSLKTPSVNGRINTTAFANYDITVRNRPNSTESQALTYLKQGQQVEVLQSKTPRGWAQVMLPDGKIGYVGSVRLQDKTVEAIRLKSDNLPTSGEVSTLQRWRKQVEQNRATIEIKVGEVVDSNPIQASRSAMLRGLRLRALIEAQGIKRSRVALRLSSLDVPQDTVSISLMREGAL
ncbi:caspase family protein [Pseudomonas sp. GXZC]|uniref:caspase family protein n=1 Tax=Pseudomonas sp. GXZC TaxID=3003351 RepID=UPI0022AAA138|nr:caspase family protein [Pseudomonas sp. GXZC]WAT26833.1 caspase family protein [Pseudomonas sp. GXZC]